MNENGHTHIVVNIWKSGNSFPEVFGPFDNYQSAIDFLKERGFRPSEDVNYTKMGFTARILLPPA